MSNHTATARVLEYSFGTSNKFHSTYVVGSEVVTQYGRIGTPGSISRKAFPDEAAAAKAADKQVAGKLAKGYDQVVAGTMGFESAPTDDDLMRGVRQLPRGGAPVTMPQLREQSAVVIAANTGEAAINPEVMPRVAFALAAQLAEMVTGTASAQPARPMLADTVAPEDVQRLMADLTWATQPKLDGDRVVVQVIDGVVSVLNRQGQPKAKNVSEAMIAPFRALTEGRWVLDGEVVGMTLHLFDVAAAGRWIAEYISFERRYLALSIILRELAIDPAVVRIVATAELTDDKRAMLDDSVAQQREGIIFRRKSAPYQQGVRSENLLKHKHIKEIDAEVIATNTGGKSNAVLAVRGHDGQRIEVGQVTTIGKGPITVGDVVEVAYLNVNSLDKPVLFQPRIIRVRTDKRPDECSIDQLAKAVANRSVI